MSIFSKKGMEKEIDKMKAERDAFVKIGASKDLQFRQLREELQNISFEIEAKNRAIQELEVRFGFVKKPPKEEK